MPKPRSPNKGFPHVNNSTWLNRLLYLGWFIFFPKSIQSYTRDYLKISKKNSREYYHVVCNGKTNRSSYRGLLKLSFPGFVTIQTWHHKCASQRKQNETLNGVAIATLSAPGSFCPKNKYPYLQPLKWDKGCYLEQTQFPYCLNSHQ